MKVAVIGAFDRFNYGDLLFPHIIKYFFNQYTSLHDVELSFFGIQKSNLEKFGAIKTLPLKDLLNNLENFDVIIVAGGEAITATLFGLYLDNFESKFQYFKELIIKKLLNKIDYSQRLFKKTGLTSFHPYCICAKSNNVVIYNAVGGSGLSNIDDKNKNEILKELRKSSYLSVRDSETYNQLSELNPILTPDSAIVLSKMWSLEFLKNIVDLTFQNTIANFSDYICLQINHSISKKDLFLIAKQIEKVYSTFGLKTVLLEIGRIPSHGDYTALEYIRKHCKTRNILLKDLSLQQTAYIIANSKMFIGTSLHGNITAVSYNVPSALITNTGTKNWYHYNTWFKSFKGSCICSQQIVDTVSNFLVLNNIDEKSEIIKLQNMVDIHFQNMATKIKNK